MTRPARILLATSLRGDPVAEANHVLPYARALGADVHLLHVFPDPVVLYSEFAAVSSQEIEQAVREGMDDARVRLEAVAEVLRVEGVPAGASVLRGDARTGVIAAARDLGATVVAVHPGEHDLAERVLLGTTTRTLLHHLEVPALLLRPGPRRADPMGEIVVPVEPDDPDLQPPHDVVGALALGLPARLRFVSVLSEEDLLRGRAREACHEAARSRLDAVVKAASGRSHADVEHLGEVIYARRASDGILRFAYLVEATLIAIRTHGRGAFGRTLLGSVCDQVATRATCSVLVFPPPR